MVWAKSPKDVLVTLVKDNRTIVLHLLVIVMLLHRSLARLKMWRSLLAAFESCLTLYQEKSSLQCRVHGTVADSNHAYDDQ